MENNQPSKLLLTDAIIFWFTISFGHSQTFGKDRGREKEQTTRRKRNRIVCIFRGPTLNLFNLPNKKWNISTLNCWSLQFSHLHDSHHTQKTIQITVHGNFSVNKIQRKRLRLKFEEKKFCFFVYFLAGLLMNGCECDK